MSRNKNWLPNDKRTRCTGYANAVRSRSNQRFMRLFVRRDTVKMIAVARLPISVTRRLFVFLGAAHDRFHLVFKK
jgi:hypothetical protein